jgi:hypothetical protein
MSNRRRKTIGSQKIARNLAIRIRRGAHKMGNPLPGHGRNTPTNNTTHLQQHTSNHTDAYWRGH